MPARSVAPVCQGTSFAISWNRCRSVQSLADAIRSTSAISSGGDSTSRCRSAANTRIAASASAIARCRFVNFRPRWSAIAPSVCCRRPGSSRLASSNVSYVGPKTCTPFRSRNVVSNVGFCPTNASMPMNRSTSAAMLPKCGAVSSAAGSMPVSMAMRYSSLRPGFTSV